MTSDATACATNPPIRVHIATRVADELARSGDVTPTGESAPVIVVAADQLVYGELASVDFTTPLSIQSATRAPDVVSIVDETEETVPARAVLAEPHVNGLPDIRRERTSALESIHTRWAPLVAPPTTDAVELDERSLAAT